MQFKCISNQITIALIINFGNFQNFNHYGGCSSAVEEHVFNLHDVTHEYVLLTRLTSKILLK